MRRMDIGPVRRVTLRSGETAWLVTGFDVARVALGDPRLRPTTATIGSRGVSEEVRAGVNSHMLACDPPEHTRLRRLVSAAFTRRRVERLRPRVQEITDALLDDVAGADEADLVEALALPLPLRVLTELFGVPTEDLVAFHEWTAALNNTALAVSDVDDAVTRTHAYLRTLLDRRRREPGADLLSALVTAREGLTDHELTSMVFLLLGAGHETTVHLIGNALLTVLTNPSRRPDAQLVEEVLRTASPVRTAVRRSGSPLDLAGERIPAGATVLVSLQEANRDPAGDDQPHLAFGHGIHYCLGAALARLEGTIAIASAVARFPRMRLAVPPATLTRHPSTIVHGLTALPVRLH